MPGRAGLVLGQGCVVPTIAAMHPWLSVVLAYALGCVSFALLAARLRGIDIRAQGSGNPGATNVGRLLGRPWGVAVLLLDVAKGYLPVVLLDGPVTALDPTGRVPLAVAAVLGHVFPVQLGFRGGKGVATTVGAFLALDPLLGVIAVLIHFAVRRLTGFVALASVGLAWAFPVEQLALRAAGAGSGRFLEGTLALVGLALLITLRHAANFQRIRAGTEDRYDARPVAPDEGAARSAEAPPGADAGGVSARTRVQEETETDGEGRDTR